MGAPYDDYGAESAGSVYLYDGTTGELLRTFPNPDPERYAFGHSVDADAHSTLIADALQADHAGRVYLFGAGSSGDVVRVNTDADGNYRNLKPAAESDSDDVTITLYDENLNELAEWTPGNGNQRIEWPAEEGQSFYFRLGGTDDDVNVHLANVIRFDDGRATVFGTDGQDHLEATGLWASLSNSDWTAKVRNFSSVTAVADSGGNDTENIGPVDFMMTTEGRWGEA